MARREYKALNLVDLLPVRLEELLSDNAERLQDYSFDDVRQLVHDLRRLQAELEVQKDQLNRARRDLNDVILSRTLAVMQVSKKLADKVLEHKETLDILKESEEFNRSLLKNASHPIVVINADNSIRYVNPAFEKLTGFSAAETVGKKPPFPYWPEENWQQYYEKYVDKNICHVEWPFRKKNGELFWVELSSVPVEQDGVVKYHISTWLDISKRKQTEEALRASDEFNNALLENAPDQIIVFNPDTSVKYVNPAFIEQNGWTWDEVIGIKSPYPWWPEEEKEKLAARFTQAMHQDGGQGEVMSQKKNGERYWLAFKYASVKSDGLQKYLLVNSVDITEHKLAEKALRESEEHFRLLTSKSPVPTIVNSEKGEIEFVNEKFTETFGYTIKDFPTREAWWSLAYPDEQYRKEVQVSWRKAREKAARENSAPDPQEYRITCKNGSVKNVEISSTGIGNKRVVVLNDITERRKAEEDLKRGIEKVQNALQGSIDAAAKMVEMRDPYTAGHQQKVAKLAIAIAREMNLSEEQVKYIGMGATVHDIGKIYVPAEILSRTGKLTELEFQMMRVHVQGSYDILKNIEFPWPIAEMVLQHHERMDGSGYPRGLKGNEIMPEARILALADTVEAMSAHRPYRPALGVGEALEEISKNKGKLYDADVVAACINLILEKGFRLEDE
jgi:PAS domain S-box-containing protein